jgi:acyl-CoA thioesterase FadM
MPRLKLTPLKQYVFSIELMVRITDINYGGHLGNDRLLSMAHEARVAFLADFDYTEHNCGGVSLIIGDAAIQYKGEAFAGDTLKFEVSPGEYTDYGFRLFYRVVRNPDGKLIALMENGMVCLDPETRELHRIPSEVQSRFLRACK